MSRRGTAPGWRGGTYQRGERKRRDTARRWVVRAGCALAVVGILVGAYVSGLHRHSAPNAPGVGSKSAPDSTVPVLVVPSMDPLRSAVAWLRGYRTLSYIDAAPSAWIARVLPVVTGPLASAYLVDRDAGGGAQWSGFVAQRCATTVVGPAAVIPAEAPRTAGEVYVEVSGQILTRCAVGVPLAGPNEQVSATLELIEGSDGYWRVARRVF